jgi:hypothetical protein
MDLGWFIRVLAPRSIVALLVQLAFGLSGLERIGLELCDFETKKCRWLEWA